MPLVNIAPKLSAQEYERNFADMSPPFTSQQAMIEANRCLYCFDAPCIKACPTRIDVPSFIKKISTNNMRGSARVILSANILGESCGRVCPTEVLCEGACVMNGSGEKPIEIGRLQRYAVDHVLDHNIRLFEAGAPNGHRVACLGSGPASLACAAELAKWGYAVDIYDRNPMPGGLNTYGIAAYKTRAADSLREVKMIEDLGVKFHQGVEVGKDITLEEIEGKFDAIFLAVGLGETWDLKLPGEELDDVYGALEFIERTKIERFENIDVGKRVAVIGAGNTAIDCVTAARRLNAETVYMIYRRGPESMPAFKYEYELAQRDGVIFLWNTQPLQVLGRGATVHGLECVRTNVVGKGRAARVENTAGSEFTLDVDMVVKALGQQPAIDLVKSIQGLELNAGRVVVNRETHQTGHPKYFAGGDCVNGGKEVVDAVAEGMRAARGIHKTVGGR
ncbi:MAG TPA: NAD(P)-dependent oxidoreductase [Terriglobia bacterium]|nr:NAD(P)-dependent oxidoreductase [Terriglobia bacterium]